MTEFIAQLQSNASLQPKPAAYREQLSENADNPGILSETRTALASEDVRKLTWEPLERQLSRVRRVYIAPDGELGLVPFEALAHKVAGSWRYLAEDRQIVYLGTGRDLGQLAGRGVEGATGARKTAVLIGNPAFGAAPEELAAIMNRTSLTSIRSEARPVPHEPLSTLGITASTNQRLEIPREWSTRVELQDLVQQTGRELRSLGWSVKLLTGAAATKEAAEAVVAPRILQFATHGYLLDRPVDDPQGWDNPLMRSMLIMAGANRWHPVYKVGQEFLSESGARSRGLSEEELDAARVDLGDGVLTAYEASGMNLHGTELVNLTACENGLGDVTPDGVVGLRQGFLLAGARSLTMSMWEVPAVETKTQVVDFYDRWLGGGHGAPPTSRYVAFHGAQLAALARARQANGSGHPFYWAAAPFSLMLTQPDGTPWNLPITLADGALLTDPIPVGGSRIIETGGVATVLSQGWGQVATSGSIAGTAILRLTLSAGQDSEAAVPLSPAKMQRFILPFDNTQGFVTAVAVANQNASQATAVSVTLRDEDGKLSGNDSIDLEPLARNAFVLSTQFPIAANA